ncbi:acyl-CoA dehydrogenase [Actinomadura sp. 9N407]|uniref:acyl-CoA dehydrogenase n=1 Tax=Actinomadura sp. 9N407 TaxID=3375154 RepID=UPI00379D5277
MSIGLTAEQAELRDAVRGWSERAGLRAAARNAADASEPQPHAAIWRGITELGLPGLHLPEEHGGAGAGAVEVAVALEELGRALDPSPYLPTVLASLVISRSGSHHLLSGLADGTRTAAVVLDAFDGTGTTLRGTAPAVLGAATADLLVVGSAEAWFVIDAADATITPAPSLDPTRPVAEVRLDGLTVEPGRTLPGMDTGTVRELAAVLFAAEAAGLAAWCLETATEYAKVREQFGRPIGSFQAVKHACADMLVQVEQARAVAWDAARAIAQSEQGQSEQGQSEQGQSEQGQSGHGHGAQGSMSAAVAATVAVEAAVSCAKTCIQLHGGIGYTWEHDAHFYLKRATTLRQLIGGRDRWAPRVTAAALAGTRRTLDIDLPGEARAGIRAEIAKLDGRRSIVDAGLLMPHWPRPYGRAATPAEQLVIDQEFGAAGVERPDLVVGDWALATIIEHGDDAQRDRFVLPTMYGELQWCQLFSEPGAGSDLAGLSTRATRTDGGWLLTGQKVWNTAAATADWGICLARTGSEADRHRGITYFLVDMRDPGVEVRPLRDLTGDDGHFNEVFLTGVRVPDDRVVGEVNGGWRLARTTLTAERVAMGAGSSIGYGAEAVIDLLNGHPEQAADPIVRLRAGLLLCEGQANVLVGFRTTLRRLAGTDPGPGASLRKLSYGLHLQDAFEFALELLGPSGAAATGEAAGVALGFLKRRQLTIGGGTSEVQRNVIAERILGLPRDRA